MKNLLKKIINSWAGIVLFIVVGIAILYFFVKTMNIFLYLLIIIGVPIFYYFKQQDLLLYIYGGVVFAFLAHIFLGIILSTKMPVVAVVSSSMQHDYAETNHYKWLEENLGYNRSYVNSWPFPNGFSIGDLPIVKGSDSYKIGEIIVYDAGQQAPIIHRIIKINPDGTYQTKGDNNPKQNFYEFSVKKEQIYGKVIFIIPKLGYFKVFATRIFGI
jgi:hypothetical protein